MMVEMIQAGIRVLEPVFIHFLIINMVQMMGLHVDAAFLTTMAACVALPIFCFMMKKDGSLQKDPKRMPWSAAAVIIVIGLCANMAMTLLLNLVSNTANLHSEAQDALFASNFLIQLIGVGIIVPIMEEVLFRGLVYNRLKDYNKGWPSIILAAGIFAVYHGNALQILFAFPMALLILAVYEKWNTLLAPVIFHMTVNISSIVITAGHF